MSSDICAALSLKSAEEVSTLELICEKAVSAIRGVWVVIGA